MSIIVRARNLSTTESKMYPGWVLQPEQEIELDENDIVKWRVSTDVQDDIDADILQLGDEDEWISGHSAQTAHLFKLESQKVELFEKHSSDEVPLYTHRKSYTDSSKSFTTPDFSNRQSWFFDYTQVTDEEMETADNIVYTSTRTPTTGWDHDWINWIYIPNFIRQTDPGMKVVVKKNGEVITTGFIIDYTEGTVSFTVANETEDVITVTYRYGNSSRFDLTATTGKKLLVDYIETQFSVGCQSAANSKWNFTAIYNGPALPADSLYEGFPGYPANTDLPLNTFEYYNANDFLNESNRAYHVVKFMNLTKDVGILPWDYLTGHLIKPPGDVTTDISKKEFNKLRIEYVDCDGGPAPIMTECEIATGTVYCNIEDA